MSAVSTIDPIAERVERLLVRHEEVQRTNALLHYQVELLTRERDTLRARLSAARSRIDALLEKLPAEDGEAGADTFGDPAASFNPDAQDFAQPQQPAP